MRVQLSLKVKFPPNGAVAVMLAKPQVTQPSPFLTKLTVFCCLQHLDPNLRMRMRFLSLLHPDTQGAMVVNPSPMVAGRERRVGNREWSNAVMQSCSHKWPGTPVSVPSRTPTLLRVSLCFIVTCDL
uniref:Uncharacterized protein n=1 Tax=Palpitomonas bilix TaxID=652834 RepID=A0A7S3D5I9_9EUKA